MRGLYRPGKRVVYLDQNFVSNIAKAGAKPALEQYSELFDCLLALLEADDIACPTSQFHHRETLYSRDERLRDAIREVILRLSSGLGFRQYDDILEIQAVKALHDHLGKDWRGTEPGWDEAFQGDPDAPAKARRFERPTWYTEAPSPLFELGEQAKYSYPKEARRIAKEWQRSFDKRLEYEIEAFIRMFFLDPLYRTLTEASRLLVGLPSDPFELLPDFSYRVYSAYNELSQSHEREGYFQFLLSQEFRAIPFVHIFCSLHAAMITTASKPEAGDYDDVMMLATILPYADIVATDHAKKVLVQSVGLDKQYEVTLFSAKQDDVAALLSFVQNLRPGSVATVNG
ncbi:MAG: hypothetical protein WD379_05490 [Dehalococcoidia bacterium]